MAEVHEQAAQGLGGPITTGLAKGMPQIVGAVGPEGQVVPLTGEIDHPPEFQGLAAARGGRPDLPLANRLQEVVTPLLPTTLLASLLTHPLELISPAAMFDASPPHVQPGGGQRV